MLSLTAVLSLGSLTCNKIEQVYNSGDCCTSDGDTPVGSNCGASRYFNEDDEALELTKSGRIALRKKYDYGVLKTTYDAMNLTKLLEDGYSADGVKIMQIESALDFYQPAFDHLVHPENVYPLKSTQTHDFAPLTSGHNLRCAGYAVGLNPKFDYFGSAINAHFLEGVFFDPKTYGEGWEEYYSWAMQDEDIVDVIEQAYARKVKVAFMSWGIVPLAFEAGGDNSTLYDEYPLTLDGVSNPVSAIVSQAAENDCVFVTSSGNEVISNDFVHGDWVTQGPLQGHMYAPGDALNILSTGSYDLTLSQTAHVDYTRTNGNAPACVKGSNPNCKIYHGHGVTRDNRHKPDILSPSGLQALYEGGTYDVAGRMAANKSMPFWTSFSSPRVAGAVAVLREARPDLNAKQIRECIVATGSTGGMIDGMSGTGYGLPNFEAALSYEPPNGVWGAYDDVFPSASRRLSTFEIDASKLGEKSWIYFARDVPLKDAEDALLAAGLEIGKIFTSLHAVTIVTSNKGDPLQKLNKIDGIVKVHASIPLRVRNA